VGHEGAFGSQRVGASYSLVAPNAMLDAAAKLHGTYAADVIKPVPVRSELAVNENDLTEIIEQT